MGLERSQSSSYFPKFQIKQNPLRGKIFASHTNDSEIARLKLTRNLVSPISVSEAMILHNAEPEASL
jgi:hypothetical protein